MPTRARASTAADDDLRVPGPPRPPTAGSVARASRAGATARRPPPARRHGSGARDACSSMARASARSTCPSAPMAARAMSSFGDSVSGSRIVSASGGVIRPMTSMAASRTCGAGSCSSLATTAGTRAGVADRADGSKRDVADPGIGIVQRRDERIDRRRVLDARERRRSRRANRGRIVRECRASTSKARASSKNGSCSTAVRRTVSLSSRQQASTRSRQSG